MYLPVISRNVLESIRLLANVTRLFADRCVAGIEADVERCLAYAESSPSLGTSLNPYIGYERAAEIVKESVKTGRSVRDIVVERVTRSYDVASGDAEWQRWSEDDACPMVRGLATLPAAEREALRTKAVAALERFRDGDVLRIPSEAILVSAAR